MRRPLIALLTCSIVFLMYGCSGTQQGSNAASDDTCPEPALDAGPPLVCPKDCHFDPPTNTCRKGPQTIIVENLLDGGTITPPQ
jgi:hypothetical protein